MKPTLLVLAAGMGSRYGGVKQIDAVGKNGECLLDFAAFDAKKCGFGKVVYIIRKDIEKDLQENNIKGVKYRNLIHGYGQLYCKECGKLIIDYKLDKTKITFPKIEIEILEKEKIDKEKALS